MTRQFLFWVVVPLVVVALCAAARGDVVPQPCVWKVCKEVNRKAVNCGPVQSGYSSDVVALIAADQGGQAIVFECGPDPSKFKMTDAAQ